MVHSARPKLDVRRIADTIASAPDVDAGFDRLVVALSAALGTRTCVFRHTERGWALAAQPRGGLGLSVSDLLLVLEAAVSDRDIQAVDMNANGQGDWTAMTLHVADAPTLLLLAGDWTHDETLSALALPLSLAFRAVHEHQRRRRAEQAVLDGYAMDRNLSRGVGLDAVCHRIVQHVARSMNLDRVTLALHEPEHDRLAVAATSHHVADELQGIRVEPGAWVMGHVYATRRSVLVRDVRQLAVPAKTLSRYRTHSFAAVPVLSGGEAIGVLAATDKKDGSPFDRRDVAALRLFSASAALAVKAAASEAEAHRLAHAATVDALTGLFNRPYLDARLHQEFERARRGASSLTLLLADIDDFKSVNDTHGHQVGDAVLQAVSGVLRSAVRVFDVCARYGGDEFAILMPSSDQTSIAASAERIRRSVEAFGGVDESSARVPRVTMSVGVAVIEPGDTPADLVRRADQCLYVAKAEGKNRVRLSAPPLHRVLPAAASVPTKAPLCRTSLSPTPRAGERPCASS
jgi:diguanylate cyclase (GGDEF)-like protein